MWRVQFLHIRQDQFVSGHPLDRYRGELLRFCDATTESLAQLGNQRQITDVSSPPL